MPISSIASGSLAAVVGTEHTLATKTLTGVYVVVVDLSALAAGDTATLKIKTRIASGQNSHLAKTYSFTDAQAVANVYSDPVPIDTEIAVTLTQSAGTARTFPWKLLRL